MLIRVSYRKDVTRTESDRLVFFSFSCWESNILLCSALFSPEVAGGVIMSLGYYSWPNPYLLVWFTEHTLSIKKSHIKRKSVCTWCILKNRLSWFFLYSSFIKLVCSVRSGKFRGRLNASPFSWERQANKDELSQSYQGKLLECQYQFVSVYLLYVRSRKDKRKDFLESIIN